MFVWIVSLTKCLLSCYVTLSSGKYACRSWSSITSWESSISKHRTSIIKPLLLFFGTLFEKDFPEDIFLLFMRVIILYIIIVGLVKDWIRIVIAVWVFVSDSSSLAHWAVWVYTKAAVGTCGHLRAALWSLPIEALAGDQKDSFVETADHWDFWLVLSLLLSCALRCGCCDICQSCGCLLHRVALSIGGLALMLTLVGSAALWWLHQPLSRLLLWLIFGRRSIFLCYLALGPTTRSLFKKYLLVLLIQGLLSAWIWSHHAVIYWNVT